MLGLPSSWADQELPDVQDVEFGFGRESTMQDIPPTTFGNVSLALEVVFLNSAVDATGQGSICIVLSLFALTCPET